MRPGSVIVDLAVEQGGNVEGSEFGKTVTTANGVTILGPANMPSHIAVDASQLYARNLLAFLGAASSTRTRPSRSTSPTRSSKRRSLTRDGAVVHPQLAQAPAAGA